MLCCCYFYAVSPGHSDDAVATGGGADTAAFAEVIMTGTRSSAAAAGDAAITRFVAVAAVSDAEPTAGTVFTGPVLPCFLVGPLYDACVYNRAAVACQK